MDFSLFYRCLKIATRWLAFRPLISEDPICGTGWGRFRWNENGRSPMVLVFGGGAVRPVPSLFEGAAAEPPGTVGVFELTC